MQHREENVVATNPDYQEGRKYRTDAQLEQLLRGIVDQYSMVNLLARLENIAAAYADEMVGQGTATHQSLQRAERIAHGLYRLVQDVQE